jgi:DNA-binding NtrC family response regulator
MMKLPATPPCSHSGTGSGPAAKCVLVVDDEPSVLTVTSRMLTTAGYVAIQASSAREALGLLQLGEPRVELVITDVVMPETDGRALGRLIAERHPGLPVLYMSAYPADDVFHRGSPETELPFLRKPFSTEALVAAVQALLARSA